MNNEIINKETLEFELDALLMKFSNELEHWSDRPNDGGLIQYYKGCYDAIQELFRGLGELSYLPEGSENDD